ECLVSIAEVDGTPAWRLRYPLARPGSIWQVDVQRFVERTVFVNRHCRWLLRVLHDVSLLLCRPCGPLCWKNPAWALRPGLLSQRQTPRRGRPGLGLVAAAKEQQTEQHGFRVASPVGA